MRKPADREDRVHCPIVKGWYRVGHLMDGRHDSYAAGRYNNSEVAACRALGDNDYCTYLSIDVKLSPARIGHRA
jgi:hypothetical protein